MIKNKLENAWDEVVWDVSQLILILGGSSFVICFNIVTILPIVAFFSLLSNGIGAFTLIFNTINNCWTNYKVLIVAMIILALAFIAEIQSEIGWKQLIKDVF